MNDKQEKEEYLERLWRMKEEGKDSMDFLRSTIGENFNTAIIDELLSEDLVELTKDNHKIVLSERGEDYARRIIRAHRLAERLIQDVLGKSDEFEAGACEFEHTIAIELVDSICTLLGHPRECPHGLPIPEGECCKRSARTTESSVISLTELEKGQSGRVAYVNYKNDQRFHKMDSLQIRPGTVIKLQQKYPSYVIECENAHIAMDKEMASNISVWKKLPPFQPAGRKPIESARGYGRGWGARFRAGRRGKK
ncbi:MAG: FeoA domain-containing protein [Deltaproteobacteria bacterium]|nr:FeoA domain-containing protein [Deltaproteobacteria bacterium]MBW1862034.1 FeoA domain-containing protein [Deltaproteobacteria bacterium]